MNRQDTDIANRLLNPRFVACVLLLLFLPISCMTALVINRQYGDLKKQASASDSTVTSLLSEFVLEHEKATIALLQSYAARPSFIDVVKRRDVAKTLSHLEGMKKISEELDLTFITDKSGILWVNYPVFPEAVGKDLSYRDWYKGVSSEWKPYISSVFKAIVADQPLAVAVCVPIFDREGNVTGILANSQRVSFLAETIRRVPLPNYTKMTLLDRTGNIIYSNGLRYAAEVTTYPFLSAVKEALQAGKDRIDIEESHWGGSTVSATVRPIGSIGWTVVAGHTTGDVLRADYQQFVTTVGMSLLFFIAIALLLLYARKQALLAHTDRLLVMEREISEDTRQRQMQEKLSHSEMKYFRLHEGMIDGFVVVGMDGFIRECNEAYQHMLGYGPDEMIMSLTYSAITPTKWHGFEKAIVEEQVLPRGYSEVYEKEYIRKDGTVFPVELRTYIIKDDNGSPIEMWAIVRDITERKQAEEILSRERNRAQTYLDVAGVMLVAIDADQTVSLINKKGCEVLECEEKEIIGTNWFDTFVPQREREKVKRAFALLLAAEIEPVKYFENVVVTGRGHEKIIAWHNTVLRDHGGEIIRTLSSGEDITERKQAEHRQSLSAGIMATLNEPLGLADAVNRILGAIKRETGFDAVGIRLRDGDDFPYFAQNGFSDDFLLTENTLLARDKEGGLCRDEHGNISLECTCGLVISGRTDPANPLFTEGGSFWTNNALPLLYLPADQDPRLHPRNNCIHQGYQSVTLIPIRANCDIVGLLQVNDRKKDCFTLEVIRFFEGMSASIGVALLRKQQEDALRVSEERYRTVLQTAMDGFARVDLQGRLLEVNESYCRMSGYSVQELLAMRIRDLEATETADDDARRIQKIMAQGEDRFESRHRRKDGSTFDVEVSAQCRPPDGDLIVVFMCDITERKRVEEKIRASLKEKEILLKEIHHRVKNNLQIVSSLLFLQSARAEQPGVVAALTASRSRIKSMALIHERLYQSPDFASVDMGVYTRNLVSDLQHSYRTDDSLVRFTPNVEDIPLDITEAIPCGLIINELVSNALKHAFPKEKEGEITIQLQRRNTNQITLTVSDNGIGLPEHVDFRKSPSLGLTLVTSLVEQLNGAIALDRRGGTAFTITFNLSG